METRQNPSLISSGMLVLIGSNLASALHYVFQSLMGRSLNHDDFGLMNSLFYLGSFMLLPMQIYTLSLSRIWAEMHHKDQAHETENLWHSLMMISSVVYLFIVLVGWTVSPWVASWLKTDQLTWVRIMILGGALSSLAYAAAPYLSARQWFKTLVLGSLLAALWRLGWGWMGIQLHHPMLFAIIGTSTCGLVLTVLVFMRISRPDWKQISVKSLLHAASQWQGPCLFSITLFCILGADFLVIRRVFSEERSGQVISVLILGRAIFFLLGPLSYVIFPKAADSHLGESFRMDATLMIKSLLLGTLILLFAAGAISVLAPLGFRLLRGTEDPLMIHLLRQGVWCLIPLSLCQLVLQVLLAKRRERLLFEICLIGACLPLGILTLAKNASHVLWIEGTVGLFILLWTLLRWKERPKLA